MIAAELFFTGPGRVEVRQAELLPVGPGEVRVETWYSAISAGTELLLYRGQAPETMAADESIPALAGKLEFPFKYGYAAVGRVQALGPGVEADFLDRLVFSFQPHQTHFCASHNDVYLLPEWLSVEQGLLLPNMETAVNFLLDGAPLVGERVAVLGQGIVGLLTTALLGRFPLSRLWTFDLQEKRRRASLSLGAQQSMPSPPDEGTDFDLVYELSGSPEAINEAIGLAGYDGRIVLGSWYGKKSANLDLGGKFHRSRIRLISSQVSTIAPQHRGRWSKTRRFEAAARMLSEVPVAELISHRIPFDQAGLAFALLDEQPGEALQVVLAYPAAPDQPQQHSSSE